MTHEPANDADHRPAKLLRLPEVIERCALGKTAIYARIRATPRTFPAPVPLGGGCVAWVEAEIEAWIAARVAERDAA